MTLPIDVFFSFRSPYSYLAAPRMVALEKEWDLKFFVRVVYPIAVRLDGWFKKNDPLWVSYFIRDVIREAQRNDTPFMWPRPDPIVMNIQTGDVPKEQPYIHRLTRLGAAAAERGQGLPFATEISTTIFSGRTQNWHEGTHLAEATARAGLDLVELDKAIEKDPAHYEAIIKQNEEAHRKAGHWGVPTFAFNGEPFFGQDRIDALLWRLKQHGLQKRT
jgi:2-hydroxychromene-2-carboxylate isomerase